MGRGGDGEELQEGTRSPEGCTVSGPFSSLLLRWEQS